MAISYNSSIATSNLIMCIDIANKRCYPGSGTAIVDATGNGYNGTLVNSPTYSSSYGGVIQTNGTNSYIDIPSINLASSSYTIVGAARYTAIGGRMICGRNNNWLMGHHSGTTENYYAEGWVSSPASGASDTNWRIYAVTWNNGTDSAAIYVNGVLTAGPNANASAGPNGFGIGAYVPGSSEYSAGQFGFLLAYNTVLTDSQILQNFNAYRGRYGL